MSPPLKRGIKGDFPRRDFPRRDFPRRDFPLNALNDSLDMRQYVGVSKSQHSQTKTTQVLIPYSVILSHLIRKVLATINFNNQLRPWAEEVDDAITYGFLPVKLVSFYLFPPYLCPEMPLSIGHILSELPGILFQVSIVG